MGAGIEKIPIEIEAAVPVQTREQIRRNHLYRNVRLMDDRIESRIGILFCELIIRHR